jgi:hypothetical protein
MSQGFVSTYFKKEQSASLLFIIVGIISIAYAIYLWLQKPVEFYQGMSYPLFGIGLVQILIGLIVWLRTDSDIARVNGYLDSDPAALDTDEIKRMKTIISNFTIYKWTGIVFVLIALGLIFYFKEFNFLKGVGAGLFPQAFFTLIYDYFGEKRGKEYFNNLTKG